MGKIGLAATKYIIKARIDAEGIVEKPDIIGAVFGQTEGLLGEDLDLRELQKGGRIGRIEVNVSSKDGKSTGTIEIPTSLSKEDTALIAAALETIERVGPCNAKIKVENVEDVRSSKRDYVIERAKALIEKMEEKVPESQEMSELVKEKARVSEITEYGPDKLPAGPDIETYKEIILVEGRADVISLLKSGIPNVIGLGGTSAPKSIKDLCKDKTVTVFLDGDRGGDLILKKLKQITKIDFVARAPNGKEVEELPQKEIIKCLRNKVPIGEALKGLDHSRKSTLRNKKTNRTLRQARKPATFQQKTFQLHPEHIALVDMFQKVKNGNAILLKQKSGGFTEIGEVPESDISEVLKNLKEGSVDAILVGWEVDQALVNEAANKKIKYVIGQRKTRGLRRKLGTYVFDIQYLRKMVESQDNKNDEKIATEK